MRRRRFIQLAAISLLLSIVVLILAVLSIAHPWKKQLFDREHFWSLELREGVLALHNQVEVDRSISPEQTAAMNDLRSAPLNSEAYRLALWRWERLDADRKRLSLVPPYIERDLPLLPLLLLTAFPPLLWLTTWRSDRPLHPWNPVAIGFALAWLFCLAMGVCWIYGFERGIKVMSWGNPRQARRMIYVERNQIGTQSFRRIVFVAQEGYRTPIDADPPMAPIASTTFLANTRVQYFGGRSVKVTNALLGGEYEGLTGLQSSIYIWIGWPAIIAMPLVIWNVVLIRRSIRKAGRLAAGLCLACGYDLKSNISGICSECGTPTTSLATTMSR